MIVPDPKFKIDSVQQLIWAAEKSHELFGIQPYFRGHADCNWTLSTTLDRACKRPVEITLANNFVRKSALRYASCPDRNDQAGWLSLMRHYGLPCRVLDWTESVLVACYFACADISEASHDASLYALNTARLNQIELDVPEEVSLAGDRVKNIVRPVFERNAPQLEPIAFALPNEVDWRMFAQQGAFTVHGRAESLDSHPKAYEFLIKWNIPAASKQRLLSQLHLLGVRQSSLFPDLQHLAAEVSATRFVDVE